MNKSIIHRINQYLLECYPSVWNTRLVWMLLIALGLHILFFIAGMLTFVNPQSLHRKMYDTEVVASNGTLLFSIAITVIVLVLWLVQLFKNNAFKNFYPSSRKKIFLNFVYYFIIIFVSSTFYLSYMIGYKTYINNAHPIAKTDAERLTAAKAAPFLFFKIEDYELSERRYPSPFDSLKRKTTSRKSELFEGPSIYAKGRWYQFYTTKELAVHIKDTANLRLDYLNIDDYISPYDTIYYTLLDKVYDLSAIADTQFTVYNYSRNFFLDNSYYYDEDDTTRYEYMSKAKQDILKSTYDMLQSENEASLKKTFDDLLSLSQTYKIKTNLTTQDLLRLSFKPKSYSVDSFIASRYDMYNNLDYDYNIPEATADETVPSGSSYITTDLDGSTEYWGGYNYIKKRSTKYYIDASSLKDALDNIDELRVWGALKGYAYVSMWIAFGLASILFAFRITTLKSVLFAAIAAGLLSIIVALFAIMGGMGGSSLDYAIPYFILILSLFILILPVVLGKEMSKNVSAIFMNLTIVFIVPFALLIVSIISMHQRDYYINKYGDTYDHAAHQTLLEFFAIQLNVILLLFGLIFLFFYTTKIKKWKALEEG